MVRRRFLALFCAIAASGSATQGVALADEFRCVFSVTQETFSPPAAGVAAGAVASNPSAGIAAASRKVTETFRLTIGLNKEYLTEQRDQSPEILVIHFPSRRVYTLDRKSKTYRESSLHAHVAFRVNELISRLAVGAGMKAAKQSGAAWQPPPGVSATFAAKALDQFRAESLFAVRLPKGAQWNDSPTSTPVASGKGWEFHYQGEPVAKFTPSESQVPDAFRRGLLHFLVHRCQIHPTIRDRVMGSGAWPESLWFQTTDLPCEKVVSLKLVSASIATTADAWAGVPADFTPRFDPNDPLDRILAKLRALRSAMPKPDAEAAADRATLEKFVDESLKRNHVLDAYLAWYEYNARTGDDADVILDRIHATNSPQLQDFLRQDVANVAEGAEKKLRELNAIDRKGLSRGHVIDVFRGALLTLLNRPDEANQQFLKALDVNPLLTSVYVLLGTNHFRSMATEEAWRCFDAAKRINPASPSLADVRALETRFERDFPEAF